MGVGDIKSFNPDSKIPTPNLDKLAADGMIFSNAYCPDSVCSPSRYAAMTGRYSWRTHLKEGVLKNWANPLIEDGRTTLPSMLRKAGYKTAGFGKWHLGANFSTFDSKPPIGEGKFEDANLGANVDINASVLGGPIARGFDRWWGVSSPAETLIMNQDKVVAYISDKAAVKVPGLENLKPIKVSEFLPEILHQTSEYLKTVAEDARNGKPFFIYFAPYVPHIPLAVEASFKGKTDAGEYGDYVHELDTYIGSLLNLLEENGLSQNTLIIFASDNGSQFKETGKSKHRPNGIYRGGKWSVYEGGVRTPLIMRWTGKIASGSINTQLTALIDILPTCAELTKQKIPEGDAEDGVSIYQSLLGMTEGKDFREFLVVKSSSMTFGIRKGKWKYIRNVKTSNRNSAKDELYDLKSDPTESNNLLKECPDIAQTLQKELEKVLSETRR